MNTFKVGDEVRLKVEQLADVGGTFVLLRPWEIPRPFFTVCKVDNDLIYLKEIEHLWRTCGFHCENFDRADEKTYAGEQMVFSLSYE